MEAAFAGDTPELAVPAETKLPSAVDGKNRNIRRAAEICDINKLTGRLDGNSRGAAAGCDRSANR